ncbi:MAG: hypothetical protein QN834_08355 [Nitrososphaeraceae archaeon]|nr:hypothetical protein [Nitrososphaeraceae archaeon]
MGLMKLLGLDLSEATGTKVFKKLLEAHSIDFVDKYDKMFKDFKSEVDDLKEKIEILEEEIKIQDDIIFDMRKKIVTLEKPSWKGKKK